MTSSSPKSETNAASAFVCDCDELVRSACAGEAFYKKHLGRRYCVFHYPLQDKSGDFRAALRRKQDAQDYDFRGVWFPASLDFSKFEFSTEADFSFATFSASTLFFSTTFSGEANFSFATFSAGVNFSRATFNNKANFSHAKFSVVAEFSNATFSKEANFSTAAFSAWAYFTYAIFGDYVRFAGYVGSKVFNNQATLDLQFARMEKPEHVFFHTLTLRPHWFVNVDARKFDFTHVDWDSLSIEDEIKSLKSKPVSSPHRRLAIVCRQLAVNAEENNRYEEASKFRFMAMEARRLETWKGFAPWRLSWWYWLASGYGERIGQAFLVLLAIMTLFAVLYVMTGHMRVRRAMDVLGAANYSLNVMALQKPEPKSTAGLTPLLITFETILGPVQAALLALAIRRKFMR
jgi:uncharacterized protein YjbI with pentapeptide repeats